MGLLYRDKTWEKPDGGDAEHQVLGRLRTSHLVFSKWSTPPKSPQAPHPGSSQTLYFCGFKEASGLNDRPLGINSASSPSAPLQKDQEF